MEIENPSDVSQESAPLSVEGNEPGNLQQPNPEPSSEVDNSFAARARAAREQMNQPDDSDADQDEPQPQPEPEPEKDEPAKPDRVGRFKLIETERNEAVAKYEAVNAQLERHGGVEGFENIANIFEAFLDPNGKFTIAGGEEGATREVTGKEMIYDFVKELPDAPDIYSDFFLRGLDNEQNRVFAVNDVMKSEFGLKPDANITQDQLNTVFELVAAKINLAKSPEEVEKIFKDFEYEVKGLDYDADEFSKDRKIAELEAQLNAKNNPPQEQQAENPAEKFQKEYETALVDEQKRIASEDNLLIERYSTNATEFIGKYGLQANDTDLPEVKAAKEMLNHLMLGKTNIAQRIRNSAAFKNASKFLHKGNLNSSFGTVASSNLNSAMKAEVSKILTTLAPLIAGSKGSVKPPPPKQPNLEDKEPTGIEATRHPVEAKLDFRSKSRAVRGEQAAG